MKILWVKADKLLPVNNGGNIRSYHIAQWLAKHHDLTFFSYYGGALDHDYAKTLEEHFPGAVTHCTGKARPTALGRGFDYLQRLPKQAPYAVSRFADSAVAAQLRGWFEQRQFDLAVCDFLDAAVNFPPHLAIPSVLFQHNVESEIWRRHAETEANPVKRRIYSFEYERMRRYERNVVRNFHHTIAVSEHDRGLMSAWVDPSRISVAPTGVDLENFRPEASSLNGSPLVVFVGAMDWEPNVDAVEYFCAEIWPLIREKVPSARFRIVGRNPSGRVQSLASRSVEVTGSVPSVQVHLREAAVVVVPLRIGGGTRLKIYEAMAMGRAVVSSSVGAEGLDVHDGRDIVLRDQAQGFAESVVALLQDRELRAGYEHAAIELANQHDWAAIGAKFALTLETVASERARLANWDRGKMADPAMSIGTDPQGRAH